MDRVDDWMLDHPLLMLGGVFAGLAFLSVLMGFGILYLAGDVAELVSETVEGHTVVLSTGEAFECTASGD
jgi:hypothetical protein